MTKNVLKNPLVFLAAGKSLRMGQPKGLLMLNDRPLLEHQLLEFSASGGTHAVVVLGFHHEQYCKAMPWLMTGNRLENLSVTVAINEKPELGSFSSLHCGLEMLIRTDLSLENGIFVSPVDVPLPSADVWQALVRASTQGKDACIPSHDGKSGHPAWLSSDFVKKLIDVPIDAPEARLDYQIRSLEPSRRTLVSVHDPRVVMNMNEPEDFSTFKDWFSLKGLTQHQTAEKPGEQAAL